MADLYLLLSASSAATLPGRRFSWRFVWGFFPAAARQFIQPLFCQLRLPGCYGAVFFHRLDLRFQALPVLFGGVFFDVFGQLDLALLLLELLLPGFIAGLDCGFIDGFLGFLLRAVDPGLRGLLQRPGRRFADFSKAMAAVPAAAALASNSALRMDFLALARSSAENDSVAITGSPALGLSSGMKRPDRSQIHQHHKARMQSDGEQQGLPLFGVLMRHEPQSAALLIRPTRSTPACCSSTMA